MSPEELIAALTSRLDYLETKVAAEHKVMITTSKLVKVHAEMFEALIAQVEALEKKLAGNSH